MTDARPSAARLRETLLSTADYYAERIENAHFARWLRTGGGKHPVPDDESEAVKTMLSCDHRYEGCNELGDIVNMLRDAAALLIAPPRKLPEFCNACFTSSWEPVPDEAQCVLKHPHEGEHAQCGHCQLYEAYRQLRDSLTAPGGAPPVQWQPIETLKPDMRKVVVLWPDEEVEILTARGAANLQRAVPGSFEPGAKTEYFQPTHWAPLPALPAPPGVSLGAEKDQEHDAGLLGSTDTDKSRG